MNKWNESDWFKNWLEIARQGQNAMRRAEGYSEIPSPLMDRQAVSQADCQKQDPNPEWETAE